MRVSPCEEHWRGAVADRFPEHLALWQATGDRSTETAWAEPASDRRYSGPRPCNYRTTPLMPPLTR
ncbi:cupin domain-containing protein [Streptomyces cellulosae]|uniref:Uncharacterized protein n=1 Tax=Streptomyces cellulosae TaxID=1968 RepID=A0ABW7YHS3_STRCE